MHLDSKECGLTREPPPADLAVGVFAMPADATRVRILRARHAVDQRPAHHPAARSGEVRP